MFYTCSSDSRDATLTPIPAFFHQFETHTAMDRRKFLSQSGKLLLVTTGLFVVGNSLASCSSDDDNFNDGYYDDGYYDDGYYDDGYYDDGYYDDGYYDDGYYDDGYYDD